MKTNIMLALAILVFPLLALSDGNELLSWCDTVITGDRPNTFKAGFNEGLCAGSISSSINVADIYESSGLLEKKICKPEGVTNLQQTKIVIKYLEENPQKLHFAKESLIIAALQKSFPCKK